MLCNMKQVMIIYHIFSGNNILHKLTLKGSWDLRIGMEDFDNVTKFAVYKNFKVGDEESGYQLELGIYSGNAGMAV